MADLTRAEQLVQTIERDDAFRSEVEAALTVPAKRAVLDARGFQDVGLDDISAYIESKGGKLVVQQGGEELSEQELAAVAGGLTAADTAGIAVGVGVGGAVVGVAAGIGVLGAIGGVSAAAAAV